MVKVESIGTEFKDNSKGFRYCSFFLVACPKVNEPKKKTLFQRNFSVLLKTSGQTLRHCIPESQSFANVILPKKILKLSLNLVPNNAVFLL